MNGHKFSLSFSKRIEKKSLQPSALGSEGRAEVKRSPQALLAVDQDSLKVNENAEEEELVIPLLQAKRSAVLSRLAKLQQEDGGKEGEGKKEEETAQENQEDSKPLTLEEKAERALLEESKRRLDEWTTRDVKKDITIPAEDPLSAPLTDIGKESTLDDYDEIAVECFGAAILRGMGWKKSEGIGGREKKVIEIIDPSTKTLGSSEGKQATAQKKEGEEVEDEEELPIVKGAYVFLHSGRHRGTYGVVEVVDEDHLLIRAAVGQAMVREVEGNLRVATQKEYRESSRVINKEMYDKFKEAEMKKNEAKKKMHCEEDKEGSGSDRDRKGSQKTKSKDIEESHREESHRETDSKNVKVKQESGEEDKNRKQGERDSERQRSKNEKERDETEGRLRENSKKQKERDNERSRDRDDERQRDRDKERQRRPREKEAEKQRYKESKQEYSKEERKDKLQDHRESDRKTWDPQARLHKDTQASGGKKRQKEFTEAQETKAKQQRMMVPPWVRENLRVRIINKNYKGGKYHKQKVVVVSVVTAESCECVAEGGRLLGGVDPAWLETVIPKQPPMVVMVVRGRHSGQKGRILQLHKDQEKASIQLLEDETTILKLHYDDICEFVVR